LKDNPPTPPRRRVLQFAAVTATLGMSAFSIAQNQPPLRFVVPFPAGTGTDQAARLFGKLISERTGRAVVVENKPGANGIIGVRAVLAAPADGNTLFLGANSTLSTNAATFKELPYDPVGDFSLLSILVVIPTFIIVPGNSRFSSIKELFDEARERPGSLNYASGSVTYELMMEWLHEQAGVRAKSIPYKGANEARMAVISGDVDYAITDAAEDAANLVKAGRCKALMHSYTERSLLLPEVPSAPEAGYPEFIGLVWAAAAVSSKTPPAVTDELRALFAECAKSKEAQEFYARRSSPQLQLSASELSRFQREEVDRWHRIVAQIGFEKQ
jgi:tripartite-type tricarboxylate transporter receptor subunit TctC